MSMSRPPNPTRTDPSHEPRRPEPGADAAERAGRPDSQRPATAALAQHRASRFPGHRGALLVDHGAARRRIDAGIPRRPAARRLQGRGARTACAALCLASYITIKLQLRMRIFPVWQQALTVFWLLAVYQFMVFWIDGITGHPVTTWRAGFRRSPVRCCGRCSSGLLGNAYQRTAETATSEPVASASRITGPSSACSSDGRSRRRVIMAVLVVAVLVQARPAAGRALRLLRSICRRATGSGSSRCRRIAA